MEDVAIRDVVVVEGGGEPGRPGDVGIAHGRISRVGSVGAARREIDGRGLVLAPGFVDTHSHDDGAVLRHPDLWFKASQGVTTVVNGNCGSSAVGLVGGGAGLSLLDLQPTWQDLDGYRREVAAAGCALNSMMLIGHNTLRESVMGMERRPASSDELERMRAEVRRAMEQGACGFSVGLLFAPGKWAPTDELEALVAEVAPFGGIFACHIRDEFDDLLPSVQEVMDIGAATDVPVHVSHHKAAGRRNWGKVEESLARIDEAVASGGDVTLDAYPYTAGSGPMAKYFEDGIDVELAQVMRLARCTDFPDYEGRMLTDIAEREGEAIEDLVGRILAAPESRDTICLQFLADEADIERNLAHPLMMVGSDGIPQLEGSPHPRLVGTFPRVLGEYVRERGVAPFEEMIRRMTSLPAARFGLVDRGRVAEGWHADLVLLDPERVRDTATYDAPLEVSEGIELVMVAGETVWTSEGAAAARPGSVLTYQRD